MQARLADAVVVLRWGIDGREQLACDERVGVTLCPDTEDATEDVRCDHTRVRRMLARMAADVNA
jgi:hypothetical protein